MRFRTWLCLYVLLIVAQFLVFRLLPDRDGPLIAIVGVLTSVAVLGTGLWWLSRGRIQR